MSDDLIKRSDAIKAVNKAKAEGMVECPTYYLGIVPSADRPQGEWIYTNDPLRSGDEWECSRCGNISFMKTNFCDRCGARMKGADDE